MDQTTHNKIVSFILGIAQDVLRNVSTFDHVAMGVA